MATRPHNKTTKAARVLSAAKKEYDATLRATRAEVAANEELRRVAAEWVGAVRTLLTALTHEVKAISRATKPGGPLAGIIDGTAANDVYCELYNADCEAGNLNVIGYTLPVPDLRGLLKKGGA